MTDDNITKQPLSQGKLIESLENQIATLRRDYSKIESVNKTLTEENNELWKAFKVRSQENKGLRKELRKGLEKERYSFFESPELMQQRIEDFCKKTGVDERVFYEELAKTFNPKERITWEAIDLAERRVSGIGLSYILSEFTSLEQLSEHIDQSNKREKIPIVQLWFATEKAWNDFLAAYNSPEMPETFCGATIHRPKHFDPPTQATAPDAATAPTVDDLSLAPALGAAAFITGLASLFKRKRKETVAQTVQALETVDQQIDAVVAHAEHRVAA